jgi:hypothetical protein
MKLIQRPLQSVRVETRMEVSLMRQSVKMLLFLRLLRATSNVQLICRRSRAHSCKSLVLQLCLSVDPRLRVRINLQMCLRLGLSLTVQAGGLESAKGQVLLLLSDHKRLCIALMLPVCD